MVSLVSQVSFGDTLRAEPADKFSVTCDDPAVPIDESNLVLRAANAFVAAAGWKGGVKFSLEKRIPMGAGLGGGSSNAVAALRALNLLAGAPLAPAELAALAAGLGSDCALFLHEGPVVMRGRGERIEGLPSAAAARLRDRRVLIFKPGFGIATPWAYARMAARPSTYLAAPAAEAQLAAWLADTDTRAEKLLFNNMESVAFGKFIALPTLLDQLRAEFGLAPRMSGSGSACFTLLSDGMSAEPIVDAIRAAWGESAFVFETTLA